MEINTLTTKDKLFQQRWMRLADPPEKVYYIGQLFDPEVPAIAIVGTRKPTPYGQEMTTALASALAKRGIVIVSGLAIGVDGIAHQAALEAGGKTIAIVAGGLDAIYPRRHQALARQIVQQGGGLISEYPIGMPCLPHQFIARNRLIATLAHGTLVTEAATKSGSLHTAQFALEAGLPVMAVPGQATNPLASGCLNLLKSGAALVSGVGDVLFALGYKDTQIPTQISLLGENEEEKKLITLMQQGIREGEVLLQKSELEAARFNQTLTMLEITGRIRAVGGDRWMLV